MSQIETNIPSTTTTVSPFTVANYVPNVPMCTEYSSHSLNVQIDAPQHKPTQKDDPGFGTHIREAIAIIKDWKQSR